MRASAHDRDLGSGMRQQGRWLLLSSASGAVLGMAFWVVAGQLYPRPSFGRDGAVVTTMLGVSALGQLNLPATFMRFLPAWPWHRCRTVALALLASTGASLAVAAVAMVVLDGRPAGVSDASHTTSVRVAFAAGAALWSLSVAIDAIFVGLHRAGLVPVKNVLFGVLKIGLVALLVSGAGGRGLLVSWVVATGAVVAGFGVLAARALAGAPPVSPSPTLTGLGPGRLRRVLGLDYLASVIGQAYGQFLPALVLLTAGVTGSASFIVPFTATTALDTLALAAVFAFTAQAARDEAGAVPLLRSASRQLVLVVGSGVVACLALAPWLLRPFGVGGGETSAAVLRILVLGCIARAVLAVDEALLRLWARTGGILLLQVLVGVPVLVGAWYVGRAHGVVGVAVAWSTAHAAAALAITALVVVVQPGRGRSMITRDAVLNRGDVLPTAVGVVDLEAPERIDFPVAPPQARHRRIRALVRRQGRPTGVVEIAATDGGWRADDLRRALEGVAGPGESWPATPPTRLPLVPMSVVVCTRDRPDALRRSLTSILAQAAPDTQVVVVDNAPTTSATRDVVATLDDGRVRYVHEPRPGLSVARNTGMGHARHHLVAFTDDDVVADPGWLAALSAAARLGDADCITGSVPTAVLDTPVQHYFERRVDWSGRLRPERFTRADRRGPLYPFSPGLFGTGANFAITRDAYRDTGPFDERLGAGRSTRGGEDLDYFFRLIWAGSVIRTEPAAMVWHVHRAEEEAYREQVLGYGVGFAAFATKLAVTPRWSLPFLARVPRGAVMLGRAMRGAVAENGLPPAHTALERRGMLRGPGAFAREWIAQRGSGRW